MTEFDISVSHEEPIQVNRNSDNVAEGDEQPTPTPVSVMAMIEAEYKQQAIEENANVVEATTNGQQPLEPQPGPSTSTGVVKGGDPSKLSQPIPQNTYSSKNIKAFSKTLAMLKCLTYKVKTVGLVHSTQMTRMLIGHPAFVSHIFPRFDVMIPENSNDAAAAETKPTDEH